MKIDVFFTTSSGDTVLDAPHAARRPAGAIATPALRLCWDVASGWYTGEPIFPDGYSPVRGLLCGVHVRDATVDPADPPRHGEVCRLGDGAIDRAAVIRQLTADGYDGCCALETHLYGDDPRGAPKPLAATVHGTRERHRLLDMA